MKLRWKKDRVGLLVQTSDHQLMRKWCDKLKLKKYLWSNVE